MCSGQVPGQDQGHHEVPVGLLGPRPLLLAAAGRLLVYVYGEVVEAVLRC